MLIMLRTKKTYEDRKKDIKQYPKKIQFTEEGLRLFGMPDLIYELDFLTYNYYLIEKSGIIRGGFTGDFYLNFINHFKTVEDVTN